MNKKLRETIEDLLEGEFDVIEIYALEGRTFYHVETDEGCYKEYIVRDGDNETIITAGRYNDPSSVENTLEWLQREIDDMF